MTDDARQLFPAVLFALAGLLIAAGVTVILYLGGMKDAKDITAVAGVFTGVTGTLVGTLLGVHVGTAGKARLKTERDQAVRMKDMAMGKLSATDRSDLEGSNPPGAVNFEQG